MTTPEETKEPNLEGIAPIELTVGECIALGQLVFALCTNVDLDVVMESQKEVTYPEMLASSLEKLAKAEELYLATETS